MANTVDERIVEARFDSTQFEKGVSKTVKKLDELKNALQLKDAGKSVTDFAKVASEGVDKVGNTLDKLSNRLTTFTGMVKQEILGTLAQQVSNAVMSVERSIMSLVNQLGSQQMHAGMAKYTDLLTSVRTLTVSGIDQSVAYDNIERLQTYSDQTNASLEQMVGLMTKIKTSGASLDTASKMVEGFSNAAFSLGVNMSYLPNLYMNFAQAYGKGSMKLEDWKTFQSFNMVGEEFRDKILEAAVAVGTLQKKENGLYVTTKKTNKAVTAGKKFKADQWENYLSTGFFDKRVMEEVFSKYYYFDQIKEKQLQAIEAMSDEERKLYFEEKGLDEWAYKAFKAGQEARSLTDVLNTLKNAISTGWSKTFELIFGKLEDATEFFTWLSDNELVGVIRSIGDFRNEVLAAWGDVYHYDEETEKYVGVFMAGETGRDHLIEALHNIDEIIGNIHGTLASFGLVEWNKQTRRYLTFPESLGRKLGYLSESFASFTKKQSDSVKSVLEKLEDMYTVERNINGETRRVLKPEYADMIYKIRDGINAVFSIASKLFNTVSTAAGRIFMKLLPVFEAIVKAVGKVFEPITSLNKDTGFFGNIEKAIDNVLKMIDPLIDPLTKVIGFLGDIGAFFLQAHIDAISTTIEIFSDAFGLLAEIFTGVSSNESKDGISVIEKWRQKIKQFGQTLKQGFTAVKDFFTALFKDIKVLLGIGDGKLTEGGVFENISKFFNTNSFLKRAKEWVAQAVRDIPNIISGLISKIGNFIHGIFYTMDENGNEVETPFKQWLSKTANNIVEWVKNWISELPSKISKVVSGIGNFIYGFFYTKDSDGNEIETPFKKWLSTTADNIVNWIGEFIESLPERIYNLGVTIFDFIKGLFVSKDSDGKAVETPLKKLLKNLIKTVGKWIKALPKRLLNGLKNLGSVALKIWNNIIDFIFGKKETKTKIVDGQEVQYTERIKSRFIEIVENVIKSIWEWIKNIPSKIGNIWNAIKEGLFGNGSNGVNLENIGLVKWIRGVVDSLGNWYENTFVPWAEPILEPLANFFNGVFSWISTALSDAWKFFTEPLEGEEEGKTGFIKWFEDFINSIASWWEGFKKDAAETLGPVGEFFSGVFGWIGNALSDAWKFFTEPLKDEEGNSTGKTGFIKWFEDFINGIAAWWEGFKKDAAETLGPVGEFFSGVFGWIGNALSDAWKFFTEPLEGEEGEEGDVEKKTGFIKWFEDFINGIAAWWEGFKKDAAETLGPVGEFFSGVFGWIGNALSDAWKFFTEPLKDEEGNSTGKTGFIKWFEDFINGIATWWEGFKKDAAETLGPVGEFFSGVFGWIGNALSDAWKFFTEPLEGEEGEEGDVEKKTGFIKWFEDFVDSIKAWWKEFEPEAQKVLGPIGEFFRGIFDWFIGLFKGDSESSDDIESLEEDLSIVTESGEILDNVNDNFKTVDKKTNGVQETIEKVGEKFNAIKEPFESFISTIGDFINKIAPGLQDIHFDESINIFLTGAASFISGVLTALGKIGKWIGDALTGNENASESFEQVKGIFSALFTPIGDFLTEIAPELKTIKWDESIKTFLTGAGKMISGLLTAFGEAFSWIGDSITGDTENASKSWEAVKDIFNTIWAIFIEIIKLYGTDMALSTSVGMIQGILTKYANINFTSVGSEIRDIGLGAIALIGAIAILKNFEISTDEMLKYGGILVGAIALVAFISKGISSVVGTSHGSTTALFMDWTKIGEKIIKAIEVAGIIAIVLALLPGIINALADAKVKLADAGADTAMGDDFMKFILGVAGFMTSMAIVAAIIGSIQIIAPRGIDPTATAKTMGSLLEIAGSVILIISVVQAVNKALKELGPEYSLEQGLKNIGEALELFFGYVGGALGGLIYGFAHGESKAIEEARKKDIVKEYLRELVELSGNMPTEELNVLIDLVKKMVDIYLNLKDVSDKAQQNQVIVNSQDVAATFRTITEGILTILTAFDTAVGGEKNLEEQMIKTIEATVPKDSSLLFGGDTDAYTVQDAADDLTRLRDLTDHDYSVWSSFMVGGAAYEAIVKFIDLYKMIIESLDSAALPNIYNVMTLDGDRYGDYWERLSTFFRQDNFGTSSFYAVVKAAVDGYAMLDTWMNGTFETKNYEGKIYNAKYTEGMSEKYSEVIEAVKNIFNIISLVTNDVWGLSRSAWFDDFETRSRPFYDYWNRFSVFFQQNNTDTSSFYAIVKAAIDGYSTLDKYYSKLTPYAGKKYDGLFNVISNLFGMFQNGGIGSEEWDKNFNSFTAKIKSPTFINEYIGNIEKIFEALKTSSLYDSENGFLTNIYFDGTSLVRGLFESINAGLVDENNLPELDATAVSEAILKAIIKSDPEYKIAKAVHQMIQDGLLTFSEKTSYGEFNYDTSGLTEYASELQGLLDQYSSTIGESSSFMTYINSEEGTKALEDLSTKVTGSLGLEAFLGTTEEQWKQGFSGVMGYAASLFDPNATEESQYFQTIQSSISGTKESLTDIQAVLGDTYDVGKTAGINLDKGLAKGIGNGQAILAARRLAEAISGSFTVAWQVHSPSKLFREFGEYLDIGLMQGIDENSDSPIDAASLMAEETVNNVRSILEGIRDLALEDMDMNPTITPVVDMTNIDAASEAIRNMGFGGGLPFRVDLSGINASAQFANPDWSRDPVVQHDYTSIINSIRGDISSLGSQVSQLSESMNGMRVILDSGAIVGGIINDVDSRLGRLGFYAGREG